MFYKIITRYSLEIWTHNCFNSCWFVGVRFYIYNTKRVFSGFEFLVGLMLLILEISIITNNNFLKIKHMHSHTDSQIHFEEHHIDQNHSIIDHV